MSRHPVFTDELLDAALGDDVVLRPADRGRPMRWFHQPWLEALTRSPPWSPYAVGAPAVAALLATGPASPAALAAGALSWTWIEYALHRFVFHVVPRSDVGRVVTFLLHRHHHRDPGATDRIAATPAQTAGLVVPVAALARWLLPDVWAAFTAGLLAASMVYEALHYSHHHSRWAALQPLRAHHLRHHHVDPAHDFGISTPLWDVLLGTGGARAPTHPTG